MQGRRRVVVTGLGGITPVGTSIARMWDGLVHGRSGVSPITQFDASTFPTSFAAESDLASADRHIEPAIRTLLTRKGVFGWTAAVDSLRDAGIIANDRDKYPQVGIAIGSERRGDDLLQRIAWHSEYDGPQDHLRYAGFTLAGALAASFGFEGPQLTIGTACASSGQAVGLAYQKIRDGDIDMMVTGGCDSIDPVILAGFTRIGALSTRNDAPKEACRPFDLHREGFVLGEGAGMLVLEEMSHAIRRGVKWYGEVRGYASSSNAYRVTDSPADGEGIRLAMSWALEDAGIRPEQVGYINAHGTSTRQNDASEATAIQRCFGPAAGSVPVSSTKSMTGHLINACGAVEAAICLLAIREGCLPPTINYTTPDPACELLHVANVAWRRPVEFAMSNSCAFGGVNASLVFARLDHA